MPNGQPVLGCARPTCFGWDQDGKPFSQNAQFFSINKNVDGFMRKSFDNDKKLQHVTDERHTFVPQIAQCEPSYESTSCSRVDQWVGGIAPVTNNENEPLMLQCCSYDVLKSSSDRGIAVVHAGEIVIGGEVMKNDRQYAFDYIANVKRMKGAGESAVYDVTVRRFPCVPTPGEQFLDVENSVVDEVEKRFSWSDKLQTTKQNRGSAIAFQAPLTGMMERIAVQPAQTVEVVPQNDEIIRFRWFLNEDPLISAKILLCFAGDSQVQMSNGEMRRMDDLKVDDWILSEDDDGNTEYVRVKSWMHRLPQQTAEFLKINLENGKSIKLTPSHFIFRTKCSGEDSYVMPGEMDKKAVWAEKVQPGECLYSLDTVANRFIETKVLSIDRVNEVGIYAPLTENGKIVVNGVLASCYVVVESQSLQRYYFQVNTTHFFIHSA
ncbi:unnamed protein product [Anisakis simplex]|uniref:Uncharacterized protein n=1 Tax=Anisakis simplex TaxID=6269 RepID=A0A3P6S1T4_ANISI|nr:unnamed protein product [Anisakis simplex]